MMLSVVYFHHPEMLRIGLATLAYLSSVVNGCKAVQ